MSIIRILQHSQNLNMLRCSRKLPNLFELHNSSQKRLFSYEASILGFWQSVSKSAPVTGFQQGLIEIHDFTGLPWWGSIILSTVLLRTIITLPLAIYQNKIMAKIELISLEMPALVKELKQETAYAIHKFKWDEKQARAMYNRSLKKQWNKLIVRENCHPAKTMILLWGQIPLWITQSVAIRNLVSMLPNPHALQAQIVFTELTVGGFLWIPSLIEVDSSFILPVLMGFINLTIIEVQIAHRTRVPSKLQSVMTNVFRGLSIVMVPIAASVPSCLCLYWVTSSTYGLAQNLLLMSPKFKRLVKIPHVPSEIEKPYQHIQNVFGEKYAAILSKVSRK